jgi:hypothetical protein
MREGGMERKTLFYPEDGLRRKRSSGSEFLWWGFGS